MAKSTYLKNKTVSHNMGKEAFPMPSQVWVAILIAVPDPDDDGSTVSEATYTGYGRVQIEATDLGTASEGSLPTTALIEFPDRTAGSDTIVSAATFDAETGGNMLYYDEGMTPFEVNAQYPKPTIPIGSLIASES